MNDFDTSTVIAHMTGLDGHPTGVTNSAVSLYDVICDAQEAIAEKRRDDWKRRQAIQPSPPRFIEPTLPERINRLNPSERHELSRMIRSLKLRKIIKRTLAEAFWEREAQVALSRATKFDASDSGSMQRLRERVRQHESLAKYERALTASSDVGYDTQVIFEPVITQSQQPTAIEVPR